MTTIQTTSHIGLDGLLHLTLPAGVRDADLDVTVILRPTSGNLQPLESLEDSLRIIAQTAGKWEGEPLERPQQGEFELRQEWG